MKKTIILLGLNELNIDFIKYYADRGLLPNFKYLLENFGYIETTSEYKYELLEPWIQWVTVHTGLSYDEHQVFRLGDITDRKDLKQIWEIAEENGLSVGAISPFNADNRLKSPNFFIPDPWTKTRPAGPKYLVDVSEAVSQAVNDNANKKITIHSAISIIKAGLKSIPVKRYKRYLKAIRNIKRVGNRALILDNLLADVFLYEWKNHRPDFASLFLNTGAHFQHHYMFNSQAYKGNLKNPEWYCPSDQDPLLNILKEYDDIIGELLKLKVRLIIATGLHQKPHKHLTYYWRLINHSNFLREIGIEEYREVLPRMSRDFLITFESNEAAEFAEGVLSSYKAEKDDKQIFSVDNRGNSLFIELVYPEEITTGFIIKGDSKSIKNFKDYVAFVAIKNGEHDGIGYYIDTEKPNQKGRIELKSIFNEIIHSFNKQEVTV